jgi:NTP pyrophosphatase (non-canonical NTP hydrolase)
MREEVKEFAQAMEEKLAANDDKGGWDNERIQWLFARLVEEVGELAMALYDEKYTPYEIKSEAVDVANLAMMIFSKLKE